MIMKASSLNAPKAKAERMGISAYLESRITDSTSSGFKSTKAWVKNHELEEALQLLDTGGYKVETLAKEPTSTQLGISW